MHEPTPRKRIISESLLGSLLLLSFGLGVLAFLVAIERVDWFHIRPMSGAAGAMAYASDEGVRETR